MRQMLPNRVLQEVVEWAYQTFPQATVKTTAIHMWREWEELQRSPWDAEEMADVLMTCAHLKRRIHDIEQHVLGMADERDINLAEAVRVKLAVCRQRTWGQPDADGVVEHVREVQP